VEFTVIQNVSDALAIVSYIGSFWFSTRDRFTA